VWTRLVLAVERVWVGARRVLVEKRAAYFVLFLMGRSVLQDAVSTYQGKQSGARQGHARLYGGPRRVGWDCTPWCAAYPRAGTRQMAMRERKSVGGVDVRDAVTREGWHS
jgi:hypothetical protein